MKRYQNILLSALMCVMMGIFHAADVRAADIGTGTVLGTNGNYVTWKLEKGVLTISGKGDMPEFTHKEVSEGVCEIKCNYAEYYQWWWRYQKAITSVVIEDGITGIAAHGFAELPNAETIVIPDSVKTIGHAAFDASGFQSIIIPDSVTFIGDNAFRECQYLEDVTLPKNINKIDKLTFSDCLSLEKITIPQKVQSIESKAFKGCEKLKKVKWEKNSTLEKIGAEAFAGCKIKKLIIPVSVKKITETAVSGAYEIQVEKDNKKYKSHEGVLFSKNGETLICYPVKKKGNTYNIPEGVKTIGKCAFGDGYYSENKQLKTVIMSNSVRVIKEKGFYGARKLKTIRFSKKLNRIERVAFGSDLSSLKLPDSLRFIGEGAFYCEDIKGTIMIPKNVNTIETAAFNDMYKVKKVVIKSKKLKKVNKKIFWGISQNIKVILPKSKKASYKKFFTKKKQGKKIIFVYK